MDFKYAFLAKSAEVGRDGGFNAIGGGHFLFLFESFPSFIPALSIVVGVQFSRDECNREHRLRITGRRPDGNDLGLAAIHSTTPTPNDLLPDFGSIQHFAINVFGLEIRDVGRYKLEFQANERPLGTLDFYVEKNPNAQTSGG
jgi:hypothetical protein